jgi:GTP cyclohydrolase I
LNIANNYFTILGGVNFPPETEDRVARFSQELAEKRQYEKFTVFDTDINEMVVINKIKVFSFCEHHLLPFFGHCNIAYIPDGKIMGLSKFQRLVDSISSKPTLQENITQEIAHKVTEILNPKGVGVAVSCVHTCMYGRGINTSTISVNTQVLQGVMNEQNAKTEFLMRIKNEDIFR